MARKSLAALVGDELASDGVPESGTPLLPKPGTNGVPEIRSPEVSKSRSAKPESGTPDLPESGTNGARHTRSPEASKSRSAEQPESGNPLLPKYLRLTRKEARLSEEQVDALTDLARHLNRRKPKGAGERITENTLIRVAVEVLLSQRERLRGTTEEELVASLR